MLLEEQCTLPPSEMRTIRLSTPSFLDAVLTEGTPAPLYSVKTDDNTSTLFRHDKDDNESTTELAIVHWSDLDTPDSSPVESESFASRWVRSPLRMSFSSKDPSERGVLVDVDGKRHKMTDLLKTAAFGGSRKYSVDGKTFKWKHINGLWQCFHSKNRMIAVFEPSIVTAAARIRILPSDLSLTRRITDMLVLTCLLLVTHPTEWQRHAARAQVPTVTLQPPPAKPDAVKLQPPPQLSDPTLRRTHSCDCDRERQQGALLSYTAGNGNTITLVPAYSGQRSPPSVATTKELTPLVIPSFPAGVSSARSSAGMSRSSSLRRNRSINDLPSSHSRRQGQTPLPPLSANEKANLSRAMSIVSRSTSTREKEQPTPLTTSSLGRSSSVSSLSSRRHSMEYVGSSRRPTLAPILSPVEDERHELPLPSRSSAEETESPAEVSGSHVARPWELPGAYPVPYTATSTSTEFSPPPYARRDPLAPTASSSSVPPLPSPALNSEKPSSTPPAGSSVGSLRRRAQAPSSTGSPRTQLVVIS